MSTVTLDVTERTLRQKADRQLLRWQARLETHGFDRVAPWGGAAVLFAILLALALARSRELSAGSDLAEFAQSAWLIGEGFRPESTLLGGNYLAEQAAFIVYPIAVVVDIFPTVTTLLIIQSLALAVTLVPIWRIARDVANLKMGSTMAVTFAYGVYSAVHDINLADFHPEALALPALVAAVLCALKERWIRYWVLVALVLSARADLGLAIAGLGVLLVVEGRRRTGVATSIIGLGWSTIAILVVQPAYAGGAYPHVDAFGRYGQDNPYDVLWGIISAPHEFLGDLASQENFFILVSLLAPVVFLPVVAPRYLLPGVPLYVLYLAADVPEGQLAEAPQTVPITAFVFVATVFALQRSGHKLVERVRVDRRVVWAVVLAASVFFVRDAASSPYEEPWQWGRRDVVDGARLEAADMVPQDAAVRAGDLILPLIADRSRLYALDAIEVDRLRDAAGPAAADVEYIILDETTAPGEADQADGFRINLQRLGWELISDSEGIRVFRFTGEDSTPDLSVDDADETA